MPTLHRVDSGGGHSGRQPPRQRSPLASEPSLYCFFRAKLRTHPFFFVGAPASPHPALQFNPPVNELDRPCARCPTPHLPPLTSCFCPCFLFWSEHLRSQGDLKVGRARRRAPAVRVCRRQKGTRCRRPFVSRDRRCCPRQRVEQWCKVVNAGEDCPAVYSLSVRNGEAPHPSPPLNFGIHGFLRARRARVRVFCSNNRLSHLRADLKPSSETRRGWG